VLFLGANALWALDPPGRGASAAELLRFYHDASGRIVAGASLSLLSLALFVVFASALRRVLSELGRGSSVTADVAFGGALLALAVGLGAETVNMAAALRAGDGTLTGPVAQALFDVSYVLGYDAAGIGMGVFALAVAVVALRRGALLPRPIAIAVLVLGIALLTPLARYALGPSFLVVLVTGAFLLRGSAAVTA
jgi:hypothetical protein